MTRIFDALRKSQPVRSAEPASPTPPAPAFAAGLSRPMAAPAPSYPARPVESQGAPLAESVELPENVVQQMTTLRVGLEAALPNRATRAIVFVSSLAGEGTTTVAHQFAWTLARDRSLHMLLVDLHAQRPTIEVDGSRRVARCRDDRADQPARAHGPEIAINLHAVPVPEEFRRSGVYAPATARELIESAAGSYDWVVLDGPPLLDSADGASLSAVGDGAIVVVQAGRTKRPVLGRGVELMRKAGANVLGSVLNRRQLEIPEFIYRRL